MSNPRLFQHALKIGRVVSGLLPHKLREKIPEPTQHSGWPNTVHARKVLLLDGCVQPGLAPHINAATARVLDRLNIQAILAPQAGCCGAVRLHLNDQSGALDAAKRNIDGWWPLVKPDNQSGVEAIVMTASGCGVMVKDYGQLLKHDAEYAEKARSISQLTYDLSEFLPNFESELVAKLGGDIGSAIGSGIGGVAKPRVTWHPPCTLQHGQKIRGKVEDLLRHLGVDVQLCVDSHLCCGSAGTYSILQSDLAQKLRQNKVAALEATQPELIVSANMACQQHLQAATAIPVKHWIELLDQAFAKLPLELPVELLTNETQNSSKSSSVEMNVLASIDQPTSDVEVPVSQAAVPRVNEGIAGTPKKKSARKSDKPTSLKIIAKENSDAPEIVDTIDDTTDKKMKKPLKKSSRGAQKRKRG